MNARSIVRDLTVQGSWKYVGIGQIHLNVRVLMAMPAPPLTNWQNKGVKNEVIPDMIIPLNELSVRKKADTQQMTGLEIFVRSDWSEERDLQERGLFGKCSTLCTRGHDFIPGHDVVKARGKEFLLVRVARDCTLNNDGRERQRVYWCLVFDEIGTAEGPGNRSQFVCDHQFRKYHRKHGHAIIHKYRGNLIIWSESRGGWYVIAGPHYGECSQELDTICWNIDNTGVLVL